MGPRHDDPTVGLERHRVRLARGERSHDDASVTEGRVLLPVRPEARHDEPGRRRTVTGRPDDHDPAVCPGLEGLDQHVVHDERVGGVTWSALR
jgi:hypothetical protein